MKKMVLGFLAVACLGLVSAGPLAAQTATLNLSQNLFRPSVDTTTSISFMSPYNGSASLILYNSAGEKIMDFKPAPVTANVPQNFSWDGTNMAGAPVASGVYFVRLRLDLGILQKKLIVIRQ